MMTALLSQAPCFAESGASPPASRRRIRPASRRPSNRFSSLAGPSLFGLFQPTLTPRPNCPHGDSTSRKGGAR